MNPRNHEETNELKLSPSETKNNKERINNSPTKGLVLVATRCRSAVARAKARRPLFDFSVRWFFLTTFSHS
jgi:hypothetical protein